MEDTGYSYLWTSTTKNQKREAGEIQPLSFCLDKKGRQFSMLTPDPASAEKTLCDTSANGVDKCQWHPVSFSYRYSTTK